MVITHRLLFESNVGQIDLPTLSHFLEGSFLLECLSRALLNRSVHLKILVTKVREKEIGNCFTESNSKR
jgi:hypothetical protein